MGGKVSASERKAGPEPDVSVFQGPVSHKPYDCEYKLVLVGDSGTGKTCFMTGFVGGDFSTNYVPTVGVDFINCTIVLDGIRLKLEVWDTAGHQRYRTIHCDESTCTCVYTGSHGIIVVYDATKEKTFDNVPCWLEEVKKNTSPEATIMLVGNKCDLAEEKVVEYRTAKEFTDERGIMLMEVSAKEGTNVELAFLTLVAKIRQADLMITGEEYL